MARRTLKKLHIVVDTEYGNVYTARTRDMAREWAREPGFKALEFPLTAGQQKVLDKALNVGVR